MTQEELIKTCRYYKGQDENPNTNSELSWYWDMERVYVQSGGVFTGESKYYDSLGGKKYDGIPYPLLIVMFTSWAKTVYDIKASIDNFYEIVDDYLNIASDHYPKDKIPS